MRTSETHPLYIDEITVPGLPGRLGMTLCPGKRQRHGRSGSWQRSLAADLARVKAWGAGLVISLMEDHEFAALGVADLPARLVDLGMDWWHLPIRDGAAPGPDFEHEWRSYGPALLSRLAAGERVLLHCMGGLGRTGTLAARVLIEHGARAVEAMAAVRAARRGTIETEDQEKYLLALCRGGTSPQ